MNPQFPIYIPSKSRWQFGRRLTVRYLNVTKVPYHVIVEEAEWPEYAKVIPKENLLVLDRAYQDKYDTCDNRGYEIPKGSGPARNFAWDHAADQGAAFHWVVDDNIRAFYRLYHNHKIRLADGTGFRVMEDFALRYKNLAMLGPHYEMMVVRKQKHPPVMFNRRIYSCNLIKTTVPFRWRGRYNEDTDLSLRLLKAGYCTALFNCFLQEKRATQFIKGGNTDTIYCDGTLAKSQMLVRLHPDVARLVIKWGRPHHYVDYRPFVKNRLIRDPSVQVKQGTDDFGMRLCWGTVVA